MTTFNIDGPITSIVTETNSSISTLTGGAIGSPATISPQPNINVNVFLVSCADSAGLDKQFQLSTGFSIGDVMEVYNVDANRHAISLLDENGNDITTSALATPSGGVNAFYGAIYRKLFSGSGVNWGFEGRP